MKEREGVCKTLVKVYDTKSLIEEKTEFTPHTYVDNYYSVIEGPDGVVVFNFEGIGKILNLDDSIEIPVIEKQKLNTKSFPMLPKEAIQISLTELKTASVIYKPISDCVRQHGLRLEQNFHEILNVINKIGLSSNDFYEEA